MHEGHVHDRDGRRSDWRHDWVRGGHVHARCEGGSGSNDVIVDGGLFDWWQDGHRHSFGQELHWCILAATACACGHCIFGDFARPAVCERYG
mgnify:CR=1 FL=1